MLEGAIFGLTSPPTPTANLVRFLTLAVFPSQERATPLHYCSLRGHLEVAEILVNKGAYTDKQDTDGNLAHHWAAGNNKPAVLEFLLGRDTARAILGKANKSGDTVLHAAARADGRECVQILLRMGASLDAQNQAGDTPLHVAASSGKQACVEELLKSHKGEMRANKEGKLPQDVAVTSTIRNTIEGHQDGPDPAQPEEANEALESSGKGDGGGDEVGEDRAESLSQDNEEGLALGAGAGLPASPKPLSRAEKKEAMAHMSVASSAKISKKTGHQKFLEKYNLASNTDPKAINALS